MKILDIPFLRSGEEIAYCDTDIFFFRKCEGLFSWPEESVQALFMRDVQEAYALRPWHVLQNHRIRLPSRLNSGLFFLRAGAYEPDLLEWLIGRQHPVYRKLPRWVEQTAWAFLAAHTATRFWSERQIRTISNAQSLDGGLIAGHFTSWVRGLLDPAQTSDLTRSAEPIATFSGKHLTAARLGMEQAKRWLGRATANHP